jgi:hypothetical protein
MALKRNKKHLDPAYFESVSIRAFLLPALLAEPEAVGWLGRLGINPNELDDSPESVQLLVDLFVGGEPPASLTSLLLELDAVSTPGTFEELLAELEAWSHTPPDEARTEYNLPLWARLHAPDLLKGIVSHAHDSKVRRLVEFALPIPRPLSRADVVQSIPALREELRAVFTAKGRSALCEVVHYGSPGEVELFIFHGTTRRLRTLVDDRQVAVGDANATARVEQRDQAMMVARVCLGTGRIRVNARTTPDLQLLRGAFGAAIFGNPSVYEVPSRMPLRDLLRYPALAVPASLASARLVEVTLHGAGSPLKIQVRTDNVLSAVQSGVLPLPDVVPVSAKFLLRSAAGGRERALEVIARNSIRASRQLDDATIEEFLALNGLLTPLVGLEAAG